MKKKIWLLVIVIELLGIFYQGYSVYTFHTKSEGTVRRGDTGQEETYLVTGNGETRTIELEVSKIPMTPQERTAAFTRAMEEIDAHLYYYKKGKLIVDSSIVSGNLPVGNGSPGDLPKRRSDSLRRDHGRYARYCNRDFDL